MLLWEEAVNGPWSIWEYSAIIVALGTVFKRDHEIFGGLAVR